MKNKKSQLRHNARRYALQALYQWHYAHHEKADVATQFEEENDISDADRGYFKVLVTQTINYTKEIDQKMQSHLDRKIATLNPVELSVLRLAIYELIYRLDIPHKVIINEALELTKEFGAQEGYKYVNAVLDAVVGKLTVRSSE